MMDTSSASKDVSEKLDRALDGIMTTLNEILLCQSELDECMQRGFLMMSKARYTIGLNRITSTQYNEDDLEEALTKVIVSEDADSLITLALETKSDDLHDAKSSNLRHRKERKKDACDEDLTEDLHHLELDSNSGNHKTTETNVKIKDSKRRCDPLNWFGVLVPQTLRQSQNHFKKATEHSCQLATLKLHLLKMIKEHDELMAKKKDLCPDKSNSENTEDELSESDSI